MGTNPFQGDSDNDGLGDSEEVRLGSNPLIQDTDKDGYPDGQDLFPIRDMSVRVTVLKFDDVKGSGDFGSEGDPYFKVTILGETQLSEVFYNTISVQNVRPFNFELPDNVRFIEVQVEAKDSDFDTNDWYDISSDSGNDPSLKFRFDRAAGLSTINGDGR